MSLTIDSLYTIAMNADIDTFIELLETYPLLYRYPIWHDKFKHDFGNATYFKTWTWKENYLAKLKNKFIIIYHTENERLFNPILYEYDPMIYSFATTYEKLVDDQDNNIYINTIIITLDMDRPYLVILDIEHHLGSYATKEEALEAALEGQGNSDYGIVDLEMMKPYFLKYGQSNRIVPNFDVEYHF